MDRHEVNPIEDWESEELSEEELDLLAGGLDLPKPSFTPIGAMNLIDPKLFVGDVKVVASIDSSYTASRSTVGASGNELSLHQPILPINLTSKFP